jgi:hypothetical protein
MGDELPQASNPLTAGLKLRVEHRSKWLTVVSSRPAALPGFGRVAGKCREP